MPFWEKCHETLSLLRMPSIGSSPSKWRLTRGGGWQQLRCVSLEKLRSQACRGAQKNNRSRTPQNAACYVLRRLWPRMRPSTPDGYRFTFAPLLYVQQCMYLLFSGGTTNANEHPPNQALCSVHTWFATLTGIFQQVDGWQRYLLLMQQVQTRTVWFLSKGH